MYTRSMTPTKLLSEPIGSWITSGVAPRRSLMVRTVKKKSAPSLSILLTKQMRGTLYLSAWRHTVSDWGSTPSLPSNTATAPSRTRRLRSTSTVKSTCPGVSMMLSCVPSQKQVGAAGARGVSALGRSHEDRLLPAVVREGAVGLRHLVRVLAALDRRAEAVRR